MSTVEYREITVSCAGDTVRGSVNITAPATDHKIISAVVKKKDPEVEVTGISLTGQTGAVGSLLYNCRGLSGVNYDVTLEVTDQDVGTTAVHTAVATNDVFTSTVASEVDNEFEILGNGKHQWGDGTLAVDTNLYRSAANVLKTDDAFESATTVTAGTGVVATTGGVTATAGGVTATAGDITATAGDVILGTAGKTLTLKAGATKGTAVLNGAADVVVNTAAVTADSVIATSVKTVGGTPAHYWVKAISAGVSFTLYGTAGDTSTLNWAIINQTA